jgi:hypothetical protein
VADFDGKIEKHDATEEEKPARDHSNDRAEPGLGPDHDVEKHAVEVPEVTESERPAGTRDESLHHRAVRLTAELDQLARDLNHVGNPNAGDAFKRAYREVSTVVQRGELTIDEQWIPDV